MTVEPIAALRDTLLRRIDTHEVYIGIIGLGYVGLPLALTFADKGFRGPRLRRRRGEGRGPEPRRVLHPHVDRRASRRARETKLFEATADFARLQRARRDPHLRADAADAAARARPDATCGRPPRRSGGTCAAGSSSCSNRRPIPAPPTSSLRDILEQGGLTAGVDFFLAFSPEREDPGNKSHSTPTIPKVVGGVDVMSGDAGTARSTTPRWRRRCASRPRGPPRRRS